jgi:nucleotide-binding universal stress UspA family protein
MGPYHRVLCPIDGSPTAERGMREAAALARSMGAELRFFYVVEFRTSTLGDEGSMVSPQLIAEMQRWGEDVTDRALAFARDEGLGASVGCVQAIGTRVSDAILEEASRWKADLIVMGTHGRRGVRRFMLGSDAEDVSRQAGCAVLLIRSPA